MFAGARFMVLLQIIQVGILVYHDLYTFSFVFIPPEKGAKAYLQAVRSGQTDHLIDWTISINAFKIN